MKKGKIIQLVGIGVLATAVVAINVMCFSMSSVLDIWASTSKVDISDEEKTKLKQDEVSVANQIEDEGAVLLQNGNSLLPLDQKSESKVNVFGWSSTSWIYSGSGSGRVKSMDTDLIGALNNYGIETNTELTQMYQSFLSSRPYYDNKTGSLNTYSRDFSVLYEPSISDSAFYTDSILDDALSFSNTAFVVISRVSGESDDCPKYQRYSNSKNGTEIRENDSKNYLDISNDETDLLNYVYSHYAKTVVIINSTNTMNLGFMDNYPNAACLLTGCTGESSASEIPAILYGEVNPSGRLSDTYAYDLSDYSTYSNSGPNEDDSSYGRYTNTSSWYPTGETNGNVGDSSATYPSACFVDYQENIYLGYKWFETADHEGYFNDVTNSHGTGYNAVVQYPFGYGLSYTSFSQTIKNASLADGSAVVDSDKITVDVTVKNTGSVAGKDAVQLYLTAPYTKGGIEKSYVVLLDYGKTSELKPGASEDVALSFNVSDWASYDEYDKNNNFFSGYEIEPGNYEVKLMDNAHSLSDGAVNTLTYQVADDIQIATDPVSKQKITNIFGKGSSDGFSTDGQSSNEGINYLSRNNFAATFAAKPDASREASSALEATNRYTPQDATKAINISDKPIVTGVNKNLKVYDNNEVTSLGLELGSDFNSASWDNVLNEMSIDEMKNATLHGYVHNEAIASIGKPLTREVDGPNQAGSFNVSESGYGYPNATVLAQTFNKDLAYEYGKMLGKDALSCGYSGLYAPGANLHRSPLGGRNYEYYSEDPYLTGMMAADVVKGCLNMGTYVYMKHFVCYEQETYRDGIYTWVSEQDLRENYLRPFKIAIDEGGLTGIMTSYNRLGSAWAGGSTALLTDLLRNEWGYQGSVITDYADHQTYMNMDQALRAGGTLYMDGWNNNGTYRDETASNTFQQCLRAATKRNIYTFLNAKYCAAEYQSVASNTDYLDAHIESPFYYWRAIIYSVDGIAVLGLGSWLTLVLLKARKDKKALRAKEKA